MHCNKALYLESEQINTHKDEGMQKIVGLDLGGVSTVREQCLAERESWRMLIRREIIIRISIGSIIKRLIF